MKSSSGSLFEMTVVGMLASRRQTADCIRKQDVSDHLPVLPLALPEPAPEDDAAYRPVQTHRKGDADDAHLPCRPVPPAAGRTDPSSGRRQGEYPGCVPLSDPSAFYAGRWIFAGCVRVDHLVFIFSELCTHTGAAQQPFPCSCPAAFPYRSTPPAG